MKVMGALTLLIFVSVLALNTIYKRLNIYRFKGLAGVLVLLLFFTIGGLLCLLHNETLKADYFANKSYTHLKIWVNNEPEQTNDIVRFKASVVSGYDRAKPTKLSGQLLVALKIDTLHPVKLKYGDELIIAARYAPVEPPYNPAEFNFKGWLAAQNIYQQTFINQEHFFKTNKNIGNPLIKLALNLRAKQVANYRKLLKNDEAFAVASTLILDYRADLSKETLAAYSKTGTIHALSVSGSHVAIIFFILDYGLFFLNKRKALRIFKFILICSLIWAYALITGLSPTVVRAAIMITIFITAKTFAKNKNTYNILAFAAFCQLVYNPFLMWDVGFQLSYISVFGLIYIQPKIYKWIDVKNKWLNKVWELIALSLAAQLVTFPLCIYYFHQFPVYFLLGNLFISLPLMAIMVLGILVLVPAFNFTAPLFEWIIVCTNSALKWIANLPYSTFSSVWINLPELILLSLSLGLFVYALTNYHKRFLTASVIFYMMYVLMTLYDYWTVLHQQKIIFFTLRKNYAAAFIDGQKAIVVTDLQATDKNFQFFIKPAIEQAQVTDMNYINLHQDALLHHFIKKDHQIIFHDYHILIIDQSLNYKKLISPGKYTALWLTGNTKFKLTQLSSAVKYKTLLIDGTNKDYRIAMFKEFAQQNRIEYHILKKNPAYLVHLTQ